MDKAEVKGAMLAQQLKHQFNLEQYTDAELLKINMALVKVEREILHEWDVKIKTDFSKARAITLLEETRGMTAAVKSTMSTSLAETLGRVSAESAKVHSGILSFGGAAAKVNDVMLKPEQMASFWKTTPVGGQLLEDWVNRTFDAPLIDKIQREVAAGMMRAESYPALAKRLKEGFGMTKNEIDTLVRTYVQSANVDAMKRVYQANGDLVKRVRWSAAFDLRTCLVCASLEGQLFMLEAAPPCPVHPRCVHPDTSVFAPDKVAAYVTHYDGPVVEFTTTDDRKFTVSVNHMLATRDGLTKADLITEGDYVIDTSVTDGIRLINPDNDWYPSSIKEQVEAFSKSPGVSTIRVPTSPEHLHGDAEFGNGYVDIITFDSLLRGDFDSFISEFIGNNGFIDRETRAFSLSSKSEFLQELWGLSLALNCKVGGFGVSPVLFRRSIEHHLSVGFGVSPYVNTLFNEESSDDMPCDIEAFGNSVFGNTVNIGDNNFTDCNNGFTVCTSKLEQGVNEVFTTTKGGHDFTNRLPAFTKFTRIKNVRRFHYTGHLYDLHCFSGLYYISGILSSNCRCTLIPDVSLGELGLNKDAAKEWMDNKNVDPTKLSNAALQDGRVVKDMQNWIFNLPKEDQIKFFGPRRFELLEKGAIKFEDLVDMDTFKVRTLKELAGDVELKLKVAQGDAEAIAAKAAKEEADALKAAFIKEQVDNAAQAVIDKAALEEATKVLEEAKAKQAAYKAEQDAIKAAKAQAKDATLAQLDYLKNEYYAGSEAGTIEYAAKEKLISQINDLEYKLGLSQSTMSGLEKTVGERVYYKNVIEGYKKSYVATRDLDKQATYLEKINKIEEKLGLGAKKTTFYDLEQLVAEQAAKKAFDEALLKANAEAEAIKQAAAEKAKKKSEAIKEGIAKANAAKQAVKDEYKATILSGGTPSKELEDNWDKIASKKDKLDLMKEKKAKVDALKEQYKAETLAGKTPSPELAKAWHDNATMDELIQHQSAINTMKEEKAAKAKKLSDSIKEGKAKAKAAKIEELANQIAGFKADYISTGKIPDEWGKAEEELKKKLISNYKAEGMTTKEAKAETNKYLDAILPKGDEAAVAKARETLAKEIEEIKKSVTLDGDKFEKYADKKGSNEGGFYKHKDTGEQYYFKFLQSDAHIDNEILASKLYRAAGIDVAELTDVQMGGRRGLASKIVDGLKKDGDLLSKAGTALNNAIKEDMAFDAWLANWDVVGMGYDNLLIKDGKAFHVDVGGSLLFRAQGGAKGAQFGKEVGELKTFLDSHKNPYSARVYQGVTREQIVAGVKKVAALSDDQIREIVATYRPAGAIGADIADTMIARKNWLLDQYPEARQAIKAEEKVVKAARGEVVKPYTEPPKTITKEFTKEVEELGFQGKSLPFDEDHVEDQNALVFTETHRGEQRTIVKMKLRDGEADQNLRKFLDQFVEKKPVKSGPVVDPYAPKVLAEDKYFSKILDAVKSVNYHGADPAKVNMGKIDAVKALKSDLKALAAKTTSDDVFAMAKGYLRWVDNIEEALAKKTPLTGKLEQYKVAPKPVKAPEPPKVTKSKDFTVEHGDIKYTMRRTVAGEMTVTEDSHLLEEFFPRNRYEMAGNRGEQYTVNFNDGVRVRYVPHSRSNWYALTGDLEIMAPGEVTPERLHEIFDRLKDIGVDAKMSEAINAEKMYLEKTAYINKYTLNQDYTNMMEGLRKTNAKAEEYVAKLKEYINGKLGYDIEKTGAYNPQGEYQLGYNNKSIAGGQRLQYRADLTQEQLDNEMKGYALLHNLTNGESMADLLNTVLANNGSMVSTTEKIRLGIPAEGMSPSSDMGTGGASYFFTRIFEASSISSGGYGVGRNTIIFKKDMLRRMDAISYNADRFGKTVAGYVEQHRFSDIEGLKKCATYGSNETIYKQAVTLPDNVLYHVVGSRAEVDECVAVYKKYGISVLPDGRKVEDVIITTRKWASIKGKI